MAKSRVARAEEITDIPVAQYSKSFIQKTGRGCNKVMYGEFGILMPRCVHLNALSLQAPDSPAIPSRLMIHLLVQMMIRDQVSLLNPYGIFVYI